MRKTTGLSLLLLIFLSLCLIIFSLLSISGATADEALSQKTADRTKEYYAAVSEANQMLAEIDSLLAEELQNIEIQQNKQTTTETTAQSAIPANPNVVVSSSDSISDVYLQNCLLSLESRFPDCIIFADTTLDSLENHLTSDINMTFSVSVTDTQVLQVSLSIEYPYSPEDTLYQLTGWKIINTDTWTPDLSQNVYIP